VPGLKAFLQNVAFTWPYAVLHSPYTRSPVRGQFLGVREALLKKFLSSPHAKAPRTQRKSAAVSGTFFGENLKKTLDKIIKKG